ncbi:MAG TPA: hypothetical protein VMT20_13300 [Terriglobia bacterium]|nr:hypothetical protein [Terriglobia bacterium]
MLFRDGRTFQGRSLPFGAELLDGSGAGENYVHLSEREKAGAIVARRAQEIAETKGIPYRQALDKVRLSEPALWKRYRHGL